MSELVTKPIAVAKIGGFREVLYPPYDQRRHCERRRASAVYRKAVSRECKLDLDLRRCRHCERSEAIQALCRGKNWIASLRSQ